jgi:UDP-N-acetylglucosamine--N-acetylmuramyl-(pentapeptide) pyrophosphoryl-undecaprenol N-acetylglucosamine transferase
MTGGGTGGHVNPALAIANTIKQNDPDAVIAYAGTKRGIENKLVPKAGYPMYHVEVRGIKRSLSVFRKDPGSKVESGVGFG